MAVSRRCLTYIALILVALTQGQKQAAGEGTHVPHTTDDFNKVTQTPRLEKHGDFTTASTSEQSVTTVVVSQSSEEESLLITASSAVESVSSTTTVSPVVDHGVSQSVQTDSKPDGNKASDKVIISTSQINMGEKETVTQSTPIDQLETPLNLEKFSSDDKSLSFNKDENEQQEVNLVLEEITGEDILNVMKSLPEQPSGLHGTEGTDQIPAALEASPGVKETPLETTTKKEVDLKSEEEGLTFNEWKQKVLAEDEKDKQDSTKGDSTGSTTVVSTSKQRKKKNYASYDCGAKILAFNPESTNPKSILNSNKDDYMINPCKVKKWVIIELCEPIQAHYVDIASLELFSSQPKMFRIYLSDRYPTKDWKLSGEQTLKDERVIQSFDMTGSQDYFAKFVKVELLDHYGDEHFCPLTILRVFGIAVTDYEDINPEEVESDNMEDDTVLGADTEEDSKNLFDSARDTVMTLVKKVLNVDPENEADTNKTGDVEMAHGDSSANGTESTNSNDTKPCPPNASLPVERKEKHTESVTSNSQGQPSVPEPGKTDSVSIVTKLEDDEQVETGSAQNVIDYFRSNGTLLQQFVHCEWTKHLSDKLTQTRCRKVSALCQYICAILKSAFHMSFLEEQKEVYEKDSQTMVEPLHTRKVDLSTSETNQLGSSVVPTGGILEETTEDDKSTYLKESQSAGTHISSVDSSDTSETYLSSPTQHLESVKSLQSDCTDLKSTDSSSLSLLNPTSTLEVMSQTHSTIQLSSLIKTEIETIDHDNERSEGHNTQSSETVQIDPSSASAVEIGVKGTSLNQEVTPSLPESWKPNTKDVMETETQSEMATETQIGLVLDKVQSEESKMVLSDIPSTVSNMDSATSLTVKSNIPINDQTEISSKSEEISPSSDEISSNSVTSTISKVQSMQADPESVTSTISNLKPLQTDPESQASQPPTVDIPKVTVKDVEFKDISDVAIGTQEVQKNKGKLDLSPEEKEKLTGEATITDIKQAEDQKIKSEKPLDIKVPMMSGTSRESALMRLSNRIKVLEQNVSLSSRFLEELSKRYKKQSEDMMKLLNKTLAKLSNMTVEHEVSNKIHEDEMNVMEKRLEYLTGSVTHLTNSLQTLNQQVTDRQMIATSVEILIIVVIFLLMSRWRRKQSLSPEVQRLIETMPSKPNRNLPERRNSISGPATPSKKFAGDIDSVRSLNKFPSETSLDVHIIQPSKSIFGNQKALDVVKKKKKKKQKSFEGRAILPDVEITSIGQSVVDESSNYSLSSPCLQTLPTETMNASVRKKPEHTVNWSMVGGSFPKKPPLPNGRKKEDDSSAGSPNIGRRDKGGPKCHRRQKSLPKQHYSGEEFRGKALNESHINQPCDKLNSVSTDRSMMTIRQEQTSLVHKHVPKNQAVKTFPSQRLTDNSLQFTGNKPALAKSYSLGKGKTPPVQDLFVFNNGYADKEQRDNSFDYTRKVDDTVGSSAMNPETNGASHPTQQLNGFNDFETDGLYNEENFSETSPSFLFNDTSPTCAMKGENCFLPSDPEFYPIDNEQECDGLITVKGNGYWSEPNDPVLSDGKGLRTFWSLFK